ncbi:hypothetical protein [uncultured Mameliella sp.]|uniref:hypothetical protein n=1 Tax=uncultured Mameliella sp. TaxID=1447087 RepID=UPI00260EA65F|nr:hypothetical protein [uncultured Mameliella sp.]
MRHVILSLCLGLGLTGPVLSETVGRFGVSASLPEGYEIGSRPGNDDGRAFFYPDGAEIRLWGGWVMEPLAVERANRRGYYLQDGAEITYDAAGADWFVLSGYAGETIFYLRVETGRTCGGEEALASLEIRYPEALRARYDPQIGDIAGSLGFGPC